MCYTMIKEKQYRTLDIESYIIRVKKEGDSTRNVKRGV
jgi:hypothetical protein